MLTRLLGASGGGGSVQRTIVSDGLMNAANDASFHYTIGAISSTDGGLTWTAAGAASLSAGSGWESSHVKDPNLLWDGSQYVLYYMGSNGTTPKVGRATASSVSGTWTRYGSNPVLSNGAGGSPDEAGCIFPFVRYDPTATPVWQMWYSGFPAGASAGSPAGLTVCYADSSDGLTWTKRGTMLGSGTSGDLDDSGCAMGAVLRVDSTYYVHYSGFRSATNFFKSMVAICTDPANSATYTKLGVLSGFDGTLTLGGITFRSNQVRGIAQSLGQIIVTGSVFNPTSGSNEGGWATTAAGPANVTAPTGLMIALNDGSWHANSAENPSIVPR